MATIELNDDTLYTSALPAGARLFGAQSAAATEPTSFGREAIYNYVSAALAPVASSGSATDLTTGTLPLGRLHGRLQDIANVPTWSQGDIIYFDGSNLTRLGPGTSGQFLKTQGAGANPTWATPTGGGGGSGDLLSTNNLSDVANATTARSNLGLAIGTNVQAWDAQLDSLSSASANGVSLVTAADYAAMRALLDLEAGTDFLSPAAIAAAYQPLDGTLTALAGVTVAADKLVYATGADTFSTTDFTSVARTLVNQTTQALMRTTGLGLSSNGSSLVVAADYAAMKALLDLEIGTDVQAYNARLADVAGASWAQGDVMYYNGSNLVRLAAGTSGHFLQTQGAAANPQWAASTGSVATDAIWDAKGDLAVGTGANTAAVLGVGTNGQVLSADSGEATGLKWVTVSGTGDVTAASSFGTDNLLIRSDGTGKGVQSSGVSISDNVDITAYDATNDGNPVLAYGASATERLRIVPTYDTGAQTLDYVLFTTDVASASADKGLFRFSPDGSAVLDIDDGGINFAASKGISIAGTDIITDSAGTATLSNIDALDATTEGTIEAAIDTLANLGSIQGVAFTFGAYAATLLNNANEAAFKAAVNLEAGVDFQAYSAALASYPDPTANDADALGTAAASWSDLFLASGGVINWANGEVTLTETDANTLTLNGGVLYIGPETVANSPNALVRASRTFTGTSAGYAFADNSQITLTAKVGYASFDAKPDVLGTQNYDHTVGFQSRTVFNSSGGMDNMYGWFDAPTISQGTVDNRYGGYISDVVGAGTVTNNYGLYVASLTAGATKDFAVYTAGTTASHFGGAVAIGTETPAYLADVRGSTSSQLHFAATDADVGGYITAVSASLIDVSGGAAFNGSAWVAKDAGAGLMAVGNGVFAVYTDTGLTPGNTFTPTVRADYNVTTASTWTFVGNISNGTSAKITTGTVELGHASANTLSASSGDLSIEGNVVYRAGGTDVPLTDGGTGSSTVAGARTNLGLLPSHPGGRLTLATGTPVPTSGTSGATTVYYTPYLHQFVPIYDGTNFMMTSTGGELSQATTDNTKSPAAATTNSNYDIFVWSDSGTIRATRGPAWSSDTSRGTGAGTTELERVQGILLNKIAITNGPAANRGTYVGTIRTDGSSQVNWTLGAVAAGGTAGVFGVWNMYNRRSFTSALGDTADTWTYSTGSTFRAANGSSTARMSILQGLQEDVIDCTYQVSALAAGSSAYYLGIGVDSTTTCTGPVLLSSNLSIATNQVRLPTSQIGWHYFAPLEAITGTSATFYGDNGASSFSQNLFSVGFWA